jgi:hypothetical protein
MTEAQLIEDFEAGRPPAGGFHHREHVRVAWCYLRAHPLPEALARFCRGLRQFAERQGVPGLYHETITVAYVLLINERLSDHADLDWERFAEQNPDLLAWKPSLLDRLYAPETLASERARRVFVMPDRTVADHGLPPTPRSRHGV